MLVTKLRKQKNRKGFTMVELVITISIIAILAAVMIPTFISVANNAAENGAMQDASALYSTLNVLEFKSIETENAKPGLVDSEEFKKWKTDSGYTVATAAPNAASTAPTLYFLKVDYASADDLSSVALTGANFTKDDMILWYTAGGTGKNVEILLIGKFYKDGETVAASEDMDDIKKIMAFNNENSALIKKISLA